MTQCVYCQKQKGKRNCPALKGLICPQCCGQYRLAKISCPSDCPYLESHGAYQRGKAGERFTHERRKLYYEIYQQGGEQAAQFLNLLDNLFYLHFSRRPNGQDWEVHSALEEIRRRMSPVTIPGVSGLAAGEAIWKELKEILDRQPIDQDMGRRVLDKVLENLKAISPDYHHSNRFLSGLLGYVESTSPEMVEKLKQSRQQEATSLIFPAR
ncbi:MAG TPA: hypothetical protein VJM80_13705 [bacterium]|nr:hypothetical protein [bacterium]